jgi:uncharacterized protein YqjF (DUF2071 family)
MNKSKTFMTGKWEDLIISTFEVNQDLLKKYLPNNTELDLYKDKALISMVAFSFTKVKFFGIKIPFHQQFGQINFRFYVKSKINQTKGVVFIREFAPKPIIAFIANKIYNEPFYYRNVHRNKTETEHNIALNYTYKNIEIKATASSETQDLKENTLEQFVVDRYIAFVKKNKTETYQYKINHNPWKLYNTETVNTDKAILTMLPTAFNKAKLISTYVVDGSSISVEKGILQQSMNNRLLNLTT